MVPLQFVSINEKGYGKTLIGANPYTAELIGKIINSDIWNPYPKYEVCNRSLHILVTLGTFIKAHKKYIIIEMKNVICASYDPSIKIDDTSFTENIPFKRSGTYQAMKEVKNIKGKSVVSERSVRQIDSMIKDKEKYQFAIVFLVNRGDCTAFKPNWQRPIYSRNLLRL